MAIDHAAVIRAGSSVLYLLVGLFLMLRTPRSKAMALWGGLYALVGGLRIYNNLVFVVRPEGSLALDAIAQVGDLLVAGCAFGLVTLTARHLPRRFLAWTGGIVGIGLVAIVGRTILAAPSTSGADAVDFSAIGLLPLGAQITFDVSALAAGLLWVTILDGLRRATLTHGRAWALAAFPIVANVVASAWGNSWTFVVSDFALDGMPLTVAALDILVAALFTLPFAWCFALFGGPHGRLARNLLLGLFAWTAALQAYALTAPDFDGVLGMLPGVLRVLSLVTVGYAILAGGFLPTPLRHPTAYRGTLAGVALASLIVTAQIAQNFLGAKYGVYFGGLVAGVVLVAAFPLQQRLERLAGRKGREGKEESFRRAARIALGDRVLTPQETLDLLDLAYRLGINPRRAADLLEEERTHGKQPADGAASYPGAADAAPESP